MYLKKQRWKVMLTEYKGEIFNIEKRGKKADIWRYTPVDGFRKTDIGRGGIICYEKTVNLKDTNGCFTVAFRAFSNGLDFFVSDVRGNDVVVLTGNATYAKEHGFHEVDRPLWIAQITNESFDEFEMIMHNVENGEDTVTKMDWTQMKIAWSRYQEGVNY